MYHLFASRIFLKDLYALFLLAFGTYFLGVIFTCFFFIGIFGSVLAALHLGSRCFLCARRLFCGRLKLTRNLFFFFHFIAPKYIFGCILHRLFKDS